jgi:hypothetical protein
MAWRDWVIHAFNENLPYDQFLVWQIAGDMLPRQRKSKFWQPVFSVITNTQKKVA